jgi:hypothetical protein
LAITVVTTASLASPPCSRSEDGDDLVAVDDLARTVHGQAAVCVTVVRDARVGVVFDHRGT